MSRYFTICNGPILRTHSEPFVTETLDEALEVIEFKFVPHITFEDDRICIYEFPDSSGRAELVWQFIGVYADLVLQAYTEDGEPLEIPEETFPQGRLAGHSQTLYDELLPGYIVDQEDFEERQSEADSILDTIFDNARPTILMAGDD